MVAFIRKTLTLLLLVVFLTTCEVPHYDLIINHGWIVDGLGNPGFEGSLAVRDGRIAVLSHEPVIKGEATKVIDAAGRVVSPGFIDSHAHVQTTIHKFPQPENFLRQGITTICASLHSGDQPYPIDQYAQSLKVTPNVVFFAGLNWTRKQVIGLGNKPASNAELDSMKNLVRASMKQGAMGLSSGLIYIPGLYASTDEITALTKAAGEYGGYYVTHMRNEGSGLLQAVRETITIAAKSGVRAQINHFKAAGVAQFGKAKQALAVVDSARSAGVDITIDTYPYTAANTYSYVLFPAWALDGGVEALRLRLRDSSLRTRLLSDMTNILMQDETGDDFSRIQFAQLRADTTYNGKTLLDYMKAHQYPDTMAGGLQAIIDLEIKGGFLAIYHEMSEDDVVDILRASYTMIETDGDLVEKGSKAWPHPRSFGAFPRVIARYVRDLKVLTLEEAVKKMTSMPADQLRQTDLGRLKEGAWADIIIFDQNRIRDVATYLQPKELSEGIDDMIISGQLVIDEGQLTGATPGRWIRN